MLYFVGVYLHGAISQKLRIKRNNNAAIDIVVLAVCQCGLAGVTNF